MKFCRNLIYSLLLIPLLSTAVMANTQPLQVVSSFSILADMAKQIGGDKIQINTIIAKNSDAHAFEPTPTNVKQLAQADVLIINGLNFEPWLDRLKQAAGFNALTIIASQNIDVIHQTEDHSHEHSQHDHHNHGDLDPHAWQSLKNAEIYVNNIAAGLIQADPANAEFYSSQAATYIKQIQVLDKKIRSQLKNIEADQRVVLTSHDSFAYFAREYNIRFISIMGLSSTAEPSAKRIAALMTTIQTENINAIFLENMINNSVLQQIAKASKVKVGGTLYSDALAADNDNANTYLGMFEWNATQIINALKQANTDK